MERLLVVGASGLLGQYVAAAARDHYRVTGTFWGNSIRGSGVEARRLDIADRGAVEELVGDLRPWGIVVTAALTGVDYCEEHPEEAEAVNALGPGYLARAAHRVGAAILHVSTDYVFDGRRGGYGEEDPPNPLGVYGRSKLEGERSVLAAHPGATIVRACAVYGWNRLTAKANFATRIIGELEAGRGVELWEDQYITPTYAGHAAPLLLRLLERGARGIFHVASPECLSRWEFGRLVCQVFELPEACLRRASLARAGLRAPRPRNSCLRVTKVEKELNIHIPSVVEALRDMRRTR